MTMRSTVFKAAAATALNADRLDYERPGLALEPGPEEEPDGEAAPLPRQPPRKPKEPPPLGGHKGRGGGSGPAAAGAPGQQEESWGGLVPLPCPPASTKQAGVGDASSRPKYQAVLPGHTASQVAAKDKGCPAAASAPPPAPATAEPGQPPPAAASESKWKSGVRKSPMGAGGGSSNQAACLKQILLLQLDLIEQQQQQLQAKEKEIEELKAERDTPSSQLLEVKFILVIFLETCVERTMGVQPEPNDNTVMKSLWNFFLSVMSCYLYSLEKDCNCSSEVVDSKAQIPEQLLARIERMERRMQLVKKDNEREKHRIFQGYETEEKAESEASEKLQIECQQDLLDTSQSLPPKHVSYGRNGKGHKRKSAFGSAERKTPVKKLVAEFSKVKSKTLKHSPVKEESTSSLSETVCKRELRSQETPEKARSLVDTPLKPSTPLKSPSAHPRDKSFPSETEDLPYLSTTEMYLCRWHQPPPSPLPLREPSPKKEETVAIPSWRDHAVEPLRDSNPSDLLENLDDSVFAKRHAKLELDEKRRKRWDIQRIREQRILQRLQLRMYKKKGIQESEPEVTSFFPEPDDVESLLITPYLPVVAFGRPLPKLTPQNFELPWLDERSRCRLEVQKKQTPHRTCRK
ncbi:male-specific lethal 1 homolog isoform X1 [Gopherus flavomarginatus]|uniref:male-specific lethal 1 homolog isoform X1 n=1 Tax=Gopherus flavomarginatus TaxID=286002 RepID=UPI0021CB9D31|nr:male-specific lethal 1 homolog isoform X1 [Gopherus flavomarginatus]